MLRIRRGDTEIIDLAVEVDLTAATLRFTVKASLADADVDAVLSKTTGAGITIVDALEGTAEIAIAATDFDPVTGPTYYQYDVQLERAGEVKTIDGGTLLVLPDVTRAPST